MRLKIIAGNGVVGIDGDRVVEPGGPFDLVLEFPWAEVRPGLINAHDHLHRNHYGRLGRPPYRNAGHWAADIQVRYRRRIAERRRRPRREALEVGAWKNLFAGVTTVVHHDAWEAEFEHSFPLRVLRVSNADSLRMTPALGTLTGEGPFCLHLAEGVDDEAAEEVRRLAGRGQLTDDLIAVHGVGMDADGIARFRRSGAALVWCPTSNLFLFGRTAPPDLLSEGVDVLLGSDSRLTGAGNLLDELRCARTFGALSDSRLEAAVGATAARCFGIAAPVLRPGAAADLVVLSKPLLEARTEDVMLVLVGGAPHVARPDLGRLLEPVAGRGEEMRIGSIIRWTNHGPVRAAVERVLS